MESDSTDEEIKLEITTAFNQWFNQTLKRVDMDMAMRMKYNSMRPIFFLAFQGGVDKAIEMISDKIDSKG